MASGFAKDAKVSDLLKEGLNGFINKPFRWKELMKIVSDTLK
ncbi:MAG: hypothetical protein ACYTFY_13585 [Planctomycetota bacterium]|jgi:FixJ family two-component response regulator